MSVWHKCAFSCVETHARIFLVIRGTQWTARGPWALKSSKTFASCLSRWRVYIPREKPWSVRNVLSRPWVMRDAILIFCIILPSGRMYAEGDPCRIFSLRSFCLLSFPKSVHSVAARPLSTYKYIYSISTLGFILISSSESNTPLRTFYHKSP